MRKFSKLIGVILTIISMLTGGCAVDLTATRGAQSVHLHLNPATQPADQSINAKEA